MMCQDKWARVSSVSFRLIEAIQRSGNTMKMALHQHDPKCLSSVQGLQGPPI
jgi:hypothetical protein